MKIENKTNLDIVDYRKYQKTYEDLIYYLNDEKFFNSLLNSMYECLDNNIELRNEFFEFIELLNSKKMKEFIDYLDSKFGG